ncbi:hypothetical protein D3C86_2066720 [compost metagenome]
MALRIELSVAITVPLRDSAPGVMPPLSTPAPKAPPVRPKLPPVTVPSWMVRLVVAPTPMAAVVLLKPFEASVCACASWLMSTL